MGHSYTRNVPLWTYFFNGSFMDSCFPAHPCWSKGDWGKKIDGIRSSGAFFCFIFLNKTKIKSLEKSRLLYVLERIRTSDHIHCVTLTGGVFQMDITEMPRIHDDYSPIPSFEISLFNLRTTCATCDNLNW